MGVLDALPKPNQRGEFLSRTITIEGQCWLNANESLLIEFDHVDSREISLPPR